MHAQPLSIPVPLDLSSGCFDHAPSPIATTEGATHVVRYVNHAFCSLVNKTASQLLDKSFGEVLPEMNDCAALLARVYRLGKPAFHTEQQLSSSHPFFLTYMIWPVITGERSVGLIVQVAEATQLHADTLEMNEALLLGALRQHEFAAAADALNILLKEEIIERKRIEEALHRAQEELAKRAGELEQLVGERTAELTSTNQQLEAFAYSVAHDLRAPLRAMQGFSMMLLAEEGTILNEVGKDYCRRISRAAQFMDSLLCDLLAFSRISQGNVEMSSVDLQSVVESVVANLQASIKENGARVECIGPWPTVLAHRATLTQVLMNLASNALKFVAGKPPLVRLRTEEAGQFVRIWIEDNGIGIEPAYQDKIFRLFTRLNGEKYPGTGIGLAIVQKGVERMGGRAGMESALNQGSRFWFELRLA
jgi:signal transduction histidine kinase